MLNSYKKGHSRRRVIIYCLLILALAGAGLRYVGTAVYLIKGYPLSYAQKMGVHISALAYTNIKNISLYLNDFWETPVFTPHPLNRRFFGLNVAPPENSMDDEYLISDLKNLGVENIRVDYGFGYTLSQERIKEFLDKSSDHFDILLHVVQHPDKSAAMGDETVKMEWKAFLENLISRYSGKIKQFEIGSLPNRKKWSRYTIPDYMESVRIAWEIAQKYGVDVLGPNIQDFEPFWQVTFLDLLAKEEIRLKASTDNLFVDRAVQPELYDTHILGNALKNLAAMDLINKTRFLDRVSERFGVDELICSYTQWNLDLPAKYYFASKERLATIERYADYLLRYYTLAAAGGYIDRIYWGEYASYKEGLLDDGINPEPDENSLPDAHHKFINRGNMVLYKRRPAYFTYKTMLTYLSNSQFIGKMDTNDNQYVFEFSKNGETIFLLWTLNDLREKYSNPAFKGCRGVKRDGEETEIPEDGLVLTGTPVYVVCGKGI